MNGPGDAVPEIWSFEAVTPTGTGLLVRWTVWPDRSPAWFWAFLTGADADAGGGVIVVRDEAVAAPRGRTLAVRADGLWADGTCEVPDEHWSLGLEAFAVRLDDPRDGWEGELGERVPFGFELDWERTSSPDAVAGGHAQCGRLWGEVLVGRRSFDVDGTGVRLHRRARLDRGDHELRVAGEHAPVVVRDVDVETDARGLPVGAHGGPGPFRATAWVAIVAGGRRRALAAGACTDGDGAVPGWLEVVS